MTALAGKGRDILKRYPGARWGTVNGARVLFDVAGRPILGPDNLLKGYSYAGAVELPANAKMSDLIKVATRGICYWSGTKWMRVFDGEPVPKIKYPKHHQVGWRFYQFPHLSKRGPVMLFDAHTGQLLQRKPVARGKVGAVLAEVLGNAAPEATRAERMAFIANNGLSPAFAVVEPKNSGLGDAYQRAIVGLSAQPEGNPKGLAGSGDVGSGLAQADAPLRPVVSAAQLQKIPMRPIGLTGMWAELLGKDWEWGASALIYGLQSSGKSTLVLQLAEYLARQHNARVLYVASEELRTGRSGTLGAKLARLNIASLNFVGELPPEEQLATYDVVVLDSKDSLGLSPEQILEYIKRYPETSFLTISASTKAGQARGSNLFPHYVDATVRVHAGEATTEGQKNRYGQHATIPVLFNP